MSSTLGDGANLADHAEDTAGKLLDSQGNVINRSAQSADGALDQVGKYIRQQPFSAALIALGIGYLIGRLRLL